MNLRQERLVSRCSKPGGDRLQCGSTRGSLQRQRHECRRRRRLPLSLLANPAVHHVRMQALGQSYTAYAGSRLGTAGQYLCLELLAVLTPPWAVLIQKLFHRLHDSPSWGRCPLHELPSRWVRQPHTVGALSMKLAVTNSAASHKKISSSCREGSDHVNSITQPAKLPEPHFPCCCHRTFSHHWRSTTALLLST